MIFDENHLVIPETMNDIERKAFNLFLKYEKARHSYEETVSMFISGVATMANTSYTSALADFFESEALRHGEDVKEIDKLLRSIIDKEVKNGN